MYKSEDGEESSGTAGKCVRISIREQLNAFRRTAANSNASANKVQRRKEDVTEEANAPKRLKCAPLKEVVFDIKKDPVVEDKKLLDEYCKQSTPATTEESDFYLISPPSTCDVPQEKKEVEINEQVKDDDNVIDKTIVESRSPPEKQNIIRPIDRGVVHQICSGQVIVTLSTAVKELVENSLDAGATKIDIRLQEYGSKLIEVSDNGIGIEEVNFEGLALKHHTSKISEFQDLTGLSTFGFRGEALSSLCALSKLTVTTRHESSAQKVGYRMEYDYNGKITSRSCCARGTGTTVILNDLFHTLPVRHREFLKNLKREFNRMVNILYGYCLVVNGTRISCMNQVGNGSNSKVISMPSYSSMKERIVALFGNKQFSSLLEIKQCDTVSEEILSEFGLTETTYEKRYQVEGYISMPNHGRSSNDRQFFFINSRPCDPVKISRVINEVYHSFSRQQNPFVCLHIKTNKEDVDVNVTPDKRTVYVQNEKILLATLKATLIPLLTSAASTYTPGNSQISSQMKLSFVGSSQKGEEDVFMSSPTSFRIRMQNDDSANESQTSLDDSQDSFAKQFSTSRKKMPSSVVARTESFLKSLRKDCVSLPSSSKRRRDMDSHSKEFSSGSKMSKLAKYKYGASKEDSDVECLGESDTGTCNPVKSDDNDNTDDLDLKDQSQENEEEQVIYDDEDDDGSLTYARKSVSVSINWQDVSAKMASMKLENEARESTVSYARRFRAKIAPEDNTVAEEELQKQITQDMFCKMEILGQFNLGFIIVKNGPDLFIVDQHASDEKFNFEDLEKTVVLQGQVLLSPLDLELPAISENIIMEKIEVFRKNGFDFIISPDAEPTKRVKLSKIPYSKNTDFDKADIEELVFMLEDATDKSFYRPTKVREMLASRACRKSVMIGNVLHPKEMRTIVNNMGEMTQPWNCPHGRPTIRHLINLNLLPDADDYTKFAH